MSLMATPFIFPTTSSPYVAVGSTIRNRCSRQIRRATAMALSTVVMLRCILAPRPALPVAAPLRPPIMLPAGIMSVGFAPATPYMIVAIGPSVVPMVVTMYKTFI